MLRRTHLFVVIFFLFSVAVWGGYRFYEKSNTDSSRPVIEMDSESVSVSAEGGDEALLKGVTARDEKDGDLTDRIFIESKSTFVKKGQFNATYAVADSDNHVTKATREVIYSDYHSPRYEMSAPLRYQTTKENMSDINLAANLSVYDMIDGNISNKIRISGDYTLNTTIAGDYPMEFIVMNSMGDTVRLPVTVTVYNINEENARPKILMRNYLINTSVGQAIDVIGFIDEISYRGYTYHRAEDGNFYSGEYDKNGQPVMFTQDSLSIENNVDFNTPGVYEVKVNYTDAAEGVSNYVYIYIVVNE